MDWDFHPENHCLVGSRYPFGYGYGSILASKVDVFHSFNTKYDYFGKVPFRGAAILTLGISTLDFLKVFEILFPDADRKT